MNCRRIVSRLLHPVTALRDHLLGRVTNPTGTPHVVSDATKRGGYTIADLEGMRADTAALRRRLAGARGIRVDENSHDTPFDA